MYVEITPEKVGQIIAYTLITAAGGASAVSFGISKWWRFFKKDQYHQSNGSAVKAVACAAEEGIKVAEQLKAMVEEMRENAQEEREIYKNILACLQAVNASNNIILEQLRTLIVMKAQS